MCDTRQAFEYMEQFSRKIGGLAYNPPGDCYITEDGELTGDKYSKTIDTHIYDIPFNELSSEHPLSAWFGNLFNFILSFTFVVAAGSILYFFVMRETSNTGEKSGS